MKTIIIPKDEQEEVILRKGDYFYTKNDKLTVYQIIENGNSYNLFNVNEVAICGKFSAIHYIIGHFGNDDIIKLELSGYDSANKEFWFWEV